MGEFFNRFDCHGNIHFESPLFESDRQLTKYPKISFRIPASLRDELVSMAAQEGISVSNIIKISITNYVRQKQSTNPEAPPETLRQIISEYAVTIQSSGANDTMGRNAS
jgi:hypothetical protein